MGDTADAKTTEASAPATGRSIRPVIQHALTVYYDGNAEMAKKLIDVLLAEGGAK
ncbi:hypothetical protein AB0933_32685 [Streptomyces venezuelae]|uniref:hypothetical protein n=1 Tax=Streptomyces venezuelae TaxID=54571 RepID=UPI003452F9AE